MKEKKKLKPNRRYSKTWATGLVVLAGLLVLGGCSSNGAGGNDAPASPADTDFSAAATTGTTAAANVSSSGGDGSTVGGQLGLGLNLYSAFSAGYLSVWDGTTGTYTYGEATVTVSQSGDTWTWTYTDGSESVVIEITRGSGRWTFTMTINDVLAMDGYASYDGMRGRVTVYDEYETALYQITWEPGSPYLVYTIKWDYVEGSPAETATVRTNEAGTAGTYTYGGSTVSWSAP